METTKTELEQALVELAHLDAQREVLKARIMVLRTELKKCTAQEVKHAREPPSPHSPSSPASSTSSSDSEQQQPEQNKTDGPDGLGTAGEAVEEGGEPAANVGEAVEEEGEQAEIAGEAVEEGGEPAAVSSPPPKKRNTGIRYNVPPNLCSRCWLEANNLPYKGRAHKSWLSNCNKL